MQMVRSRPRVGREEVAIMKELLGVLAMLIGIPLVIGGLFVAGVAGCMDPTIAGGGQNQAWESMGMMAMLLGSLLCWGGWKLRRSQKE
jgi:hypothetical protein